MSELSNANKDSIFNAPPSIPKRRHEALKFNGWGYNDAKFVLTEDKNVMFVGSNYEVISGNVLPNFVNWLKQTLDIDINYANKEIAANKVWGQDDVRGEVQNVALVDEMRTSGMDVSCDVEDRVFRGHGHTLHEIWSLRKGYLPRVPDVVVWPRSHEQVVTVVALAAKHGAVLIPFGGGTSVTGALLCPEAERRTIISLDTSQMNRILWLDETNLTVRIEAGIVGQDMERRLALLGYCVGHEPDSFEFSSLGGWVATRASGMKKNIYGNIEDIVVHVTMVTPRGTLQKDCQLSNIEVPRVSTGPDVHHFILGSEGTLGVVTEVTLKIRKLPKFKKYGSIIFADLESGFNCLREVAKQRIFPASIRLMDNEQFHFGMALKCGASSVVTKFIDGVKRIYLLQYKGYDPHKLCVATLLMEGSSRAEVANQERLLMDIAKQHRGMSGGEENGKRGYLLTFVIAYIRDLGLDYGIMSESFETSVPWDRALDLCAAVKKRVVDDGKRLGVVRPVFVTCRITQIYDAGVCVYFYLALNCGDEKGVSGNTGGRIGGVGGVVSGDGGSTSTGMGGGGANAHANTGVAVTSTLAQGQESLPVTKTTDVTHDTHSDIDPVHIYEQVEDAAREEILAMGGSLSHHHGVGKIRSKWLEQVISPAGLASLKSIKNALDPENIFANGSLFDSTINAKL